MNKFIEIVLELCILCLFCLIIWLITKTEQHIPPLLWKEQEIPYDQLSTGDLLIMFDVVFPVSHVAMVVKSPFYGQTVIWHIQSNVRPSHFESVHQVIHKGQKSFRGVFVRKHQGPTIPHRRLVQTIKKYSHVKFNKLTLIPYLSEVFHKYTKIPLTLPTLEFEKEETMYCLLLVFTVLQEVDVVKPVIPNLSVYLAPWRLIDPDQDFLNEQTINDHYYLPPVKIF